MENLKNNNEEFFKEIIEIYQRQLFLIAKVRLKDDFLASDAVQETFVALYLNMHKIKKSEKLKSWMTKTLINKCNDIIRKNKIYSFNIEYEKFSSCTRCLHFFLHPLTGTGAYFPASSLLELMTWT